MNPGARARDDRRGAP